MSFRRLVPLLALLALLVAPFGRMAAAEAMAMPRHAAAAMAGHCDEGSAPGEERSDRSVDCMTACAVMTPAEAPALTSPPPIGAVPVSVAVSTFSGLHPEADPPPPRLS